MGALPRSFGGEILAIWIVLAATGEQMRGGVFGRCVRGTSRDRAGRHTRLMEGLPPRSRVPVRDSAETRAGRGVFGDRWMTAMWPGPGVFCSMSVSELSHGPGLDSAGLSWKGGCLEWTETGLSVFHVFC